MINLKRRKPKPPGVDTICTIKPAVLEKMMDLSSYTNGSVSYIKEIEDNLIYKSSVKKTLAYNNKVMCADQLLCYVANNSIFDGVVEVIPLEIRQDSHTAIGLRTIIEKQGTFLMRLDSLEIARQGAIIDVQNMYRDTTLNYIRMMIVDEERYNKPNFTWGNK